VEGESGPEEDQGEQQNEQEESHAATLTPSISAAIPVDVLQSEDVARGGSITRRAGTNVVDVGLASALPGTANGDQGGSMVGGLVASIIVFGVGAVLDFAVTTTTEQHGFDVQTVGVILMVIGVIGAVLSLIALLATSFRRHRTVIDDGRGHVVRREDANY
jgi:hypothetical protein